MDERRRTAYHEAGHAVMACLVKLLFHKVSIMEDEDSLGRLLTSFPPWFDPDLDADTRTRRMIEKYVICCLAGDVAERMVPGLQSRLEGSDDLHHAVDLASYFAPAEETGPFLDWLTARAERILGVPGASAAITALADHLVEHGEISSRRTRKLLRQAWPSSAAMVAQV